MRLFAKRITLALLLALITTPVVALAGVGVSVGKFNNNSPKTQALKSFNVELSRAIADELHQVKGLDVSLPDEKLVAEEKKLGALTGDKTIALEPDSSRYMVTGDFKARRKKLSVNIKLLDLKTAKVLATGRVKGKLADLDGVKKDAAKKARKLVETSLSKQLAKVDDNVENAPFEDETETVVTPDGPQTVKVKGYGSAPLKGPATMYKKVALMVAQRDAIERAIGSVVQIEAVPEDEYRRVVAKTSAHISQKVIHRGKEGGFYVIEIEATVTVPEDIIKKYPKSALEDREVTGFKALIEKTPYGEINWRDGYLTVTGIGKPDANPLMAKRSAVVDARAKALEMISGLRYDPEAAAGDITAKDQKLAYQVFGLVQGAEVISESKTLDGGYKITMKVPLRGIRGLTATLTDFRTKGAPPQPPPDVPGEEEADEDTYTGIIIDARGTDAMPAFFPEIVDEDGNVVFNVDMVDPDALKKRGMAAYVIGEEEKIPDEDINSETGYLLGPNPLRIVAVPVIELVSLDTDFLSILLPKTLEKQITKKYKKRKKRKRKVRLRQGKKPTKIKAYKSGGKKKARIIVKRKAGRKIARLNRKTRIIKRCRVVIITNSMIGGTEGKAPPGNKTITVIAASP